MKVCVAGPESSGTRMVTAILNRCEGVEVYHSSPAFREWAVDATGRRYKYWKGECDAFVLVVRNGSWNMRSMLHRERLADDRGPREQLADDLLEVLADARHNETPVYVVTYEALVHETVPALRALCSDMRIAYPEGYDPVQDGNRKFYDPKGWAGDDRWLDERGVQT